MVNIRIMDRSGDRTLCVTKQVIEDEIEPLMRERGYVLTAKLRGSQEQVALQRPGQIDAKTHEELVLRPAIMAG
jgi:hypothetical protein